MSEFFFKFSFWRVKYFLVLMSELNKKDLRPDDLVYKLGRPDELVSWKLFHSWKQEFKKYFSPQNENLKTFHSSTRDFKNISLTKTRIFFFKHLP